MDNRVAGCQPPAGATPLLRFGLPSPPGVVGMVMAPGSASGKHPFYVVCKCGLGCCVCGGRRVGVGAWGRGPLVMFHVRPLFVDGGGCMWVKCPCGGFGLHPGCWVLGWCWCLRWVVWLSAAVVVVHYFALLCCTACYVLLCVGEFHCVPLLALACYAALCLPLIAPAGGGAMSALCVLPPSLQGPTPKTPLVVLPACGLLVHPPDLARPPPHGPTTPPL